MAASFDSNQVGDALKQRCCELIDSLLGDDPVRAESELASLSRRVQELVERKSRMEGSKTDTRDLIAELTFSRLRAAMQELHHDADGFDEQRAAQWVMGALFSMTTLNEIAQAFDHALLQSAHGNQDFNFASRTDFVSLEEVMQMLGTGKHTGCLSLEKADNRLDVYLHSGRVAFLDPHHMIRRVIPAEDVLHQREIPAEDIAAAEQHRGVDGDPVLLQLFEAGHFPFQEVRDVLRTFGREVLLDFMIGTEPFVFFFRRLEQLPRFVGEHDMRLGVTSLLLDISKTLDDWRQMQRWFPDADEPIMPSDDMFVGMADTALDVVQLKLVSQINGQVSPRQLVGLLGVPLFDVYQLLVQMAQDGIVRSPAGHVPAAGLQMTVEESMQEAFAALDANDDEAVRTRALDRMLGEDAVAEDEVGLGDEHEDDSGDPEAGPLGLSGDGSDSTQDQDWTGAERRLDRGFLRMLGKRKRD
ncbi:MAG: DUF4388 domain-containing protein [Planctomycetota bacterium]|nr:DUF4388 domain-containing protein [Planctomycetota bacterium]